MKRELQSAGLLYEGNDDVVGLLDKSLAGYVEPPVRIPMRRGSGVFAISAGVYTGAGCAVEDTVLIYDSHHRSRVARINAAYRNDYSYRLSSIDVGQRNPTGERIVASSWIVSNCNSDWNGTLYRIDAIRPQAIQPLFSASPWARNSAGIQAQVLGRIVEFRYVSRYRDSELMEGTMLDRFKIVGHSVERQPPLASNRAGFLARWLELAPEDLRAFTDFGGLGRDSAIGIFRKAGMLTWKSAANCGRYWQLTAEESESNIERTFIVSGSRAMDWRLTSITAKPD